MKKLLLILFLFVALPYSLMAQKYNYEFFVGYGAFPAPQILNIKTVDVPQDMYSLAKCTTDNKKASSAVNVGFSFYASKNLALGLMYSYSQVKEDFLLGSLGTIGNKKDAFNIVMPNVKFIWLNTKKINLYSRAGVGLSFVTTKLSISEKVAPVLDTSNSKENKTLFAWQVSPVGGEVKFNVFALFVEAGFGYSGCVQAGVRVRL